MYFYELWEAQLTSFIHKLHGFFITLYQITGPCSDASNLSKNFSGTYRPWVCCAIEYSFLKRNLYGFVQNFNRTMFVRFDTILMIVLKSCNHFHNILRLFDVLKNSPFTTSEAIRDYYLQTWYIRFASRVAEQIKILRVKILGN